MVLNVQLYSSAHEGTGDETAQKEGGGELVSKAASTGKGVYLVTFRIS